MPDQVLQDIKDRVNIVEIIGSYIPLKKAGASFRAPCPFHHEKTPSLHVSLQKQIWHCFGCGEGGDVFEFVKKFENLEFKDALKILAEKAGIELPKFRPQNQKEQDEKEILLRISDFAARFYHQILTKETVGQSALKYLQNRGLNLETITKWQIGFAPMEFHLLEKALEKKQVSLEMAVKAGVLAKNDRGQIYDRFRGRITFPILNYVGDCVGFSARILPEFDDGKSGKYVNSPETLIYNKSQILFGLNFAKNTIRQKDEAVVVEGQMDCIACHNAGFTNTVASSGTALTQIQLNVLLRLTQNLKFCFDSDPAGLSATKRAVQGYLGQNANIKIVNLGQHKDPDELLKHSPEKFSKAILEAENFLDFYLQKLFHNFFGQLEQKKHIAKEVLPLIAKLQDPLEQDHYINLLANKFQTKPEVLRVALQKFIKKEKKDFFSENSTVKSLIQKTAGLEKQILGGCLLLPKYKVLVLTQGELSDFEDFEVRKIFEPVFLKQAEKFDPNSPVAKEAEFMVESLLEDYNNDEEKLSKDLLKAFFLLRVLGLKRKQENLSKQIKFAEQQKDFSLVQKLQTDFSEFSKVRQEFQKLL